MMIAKKLFFATICKLASSILIVIFGVTTSVLINRHYGIEEYGLLVMIFTITGFLSGFTNLGASFTINRLIPKMEKSKSAKSKENVGYIVLTAGIFLCLGTVVFALFMFFLKDFIISYYKTPRLAGFIGAGAFYLIGFSIVNFIFSLYQSFQDWFKEGILNIIYPLVYLALIFIFLRFSIVAVLYANVIAASLTVIFGIFLLRAKIELKQVLSYRREIFRLHYKEFTSFGLPLLLPQLAAFLVIWADKFLLGRYGGPRELSIYYIAFNLINGLMIFTKTFFTVFMPYAASLTSDEEIRHRYGAFLKINIHFSIVVSLIMFFLVDWAVKLLYGPGYERVAFMFKLMLPLVLVKSVLLTPSIFLQNVFGMVKVLNIGSFGLAVLDMILCIVFIKHYGVFGAVAAVFAAHFLYMCWMLWFIPKVRELTPFKTLSNYFFILASFAVIYFLMYFLKISHIISVLPFLVVFYIAVLVKTKELNFLFSSFRGLFFPALGVVNK